MTEALMVNKGGKTFNPASEGVHAAVLAAIVDKGEVQTEWGLKAQCMLVFILDENDEEDKPKLAFASYTRSLNEKARLYAAVKAITQANPPEEMNLMDLVGKQTSLVIEHKESKAGRVYANIVSYLKPQKGKEVTVPEGWTFTPKTKTDGPITNSDIPF